MEGPAVKRFVTAPSISWSMLTSEYLSGRHGRFPEDAGARLTMERLRRRIRLICAGCSEEQSGMTPLRRELPPSRGASRPDPEAGRRIASARTLQSCSHRAVADAARESRSHYPRPLLASVTMVTRLGAGSRVESWRCQRSPNNPHRWSLKIPHPPHEGGHRHDGDIVDGRDGGHGRHWPRGHTPRGGTHGSGGLLARGASAVPRGEAGRAPEPPAGHHPDAHEGQLLQPGARGRARPSP